MHVVLHFERGIVFFRHKEKKNARHFVTSDRAKGSGGEPLGRIKYRFLLIREVHLACRHKHFERS